VGSLGPTTASAGVPAAPCSGAKPGAASQALTVKTHPTHLAHEARRLEQDARLARQEAGYHDQRAHGFEQRLDELPVWKVSDRRVTRNEIAASYDLAGTSRGRADGLAARAREADGWGRDRGR
jgi:hypothetical protein